MTEDIKKKVLEEMRFLDVDGTISIIKPDVEKAIDLTEKLVREECERKHRKPRVLVACEFSGIIRKAFKKKGWDAWSCYLLPTEIPG